MMTSKLRKANAYIVGGPVSKNIGLKFALCRAGGGYLIDYHILIKINSDVRSEKNRLKYGTI